MLTFVFKPLYYYFILTMSSKVRPAFMCPKQELAYAAKPTKIISVTSGDYLKDNCKTPLRIHCN